MVSERKIWEAKCGGYKVVFSHIIFGNGEIPDTYYAIKIKNGIESILSKHRKKSPAMKSCEKDYKKNIKG